MNFNYVTDAFPISTHHTFAHVQARILREDMLGYLAWLRDPNGWEKYHRSLAAQKRGSALYAICLPSKELLLSILLLLLTKEAMRPRGWGALHLLVLAVPLVPTALLGLLLLCRGLCARACPARRISPSGGEAADATAAPRLHLAELLLPADDGALRRRVAAPLCLLLLAAEVALVVRYEPDLPRAVWATLVCARYFSWRALFNALGYLRFRAVWAVESAIASLVQLTVSAHHLIADLIFGVLLQLPVLAIACVPFVAQVHRLLLFQTTARALNKSADLYDKAVPLMLTPSKRRLTMRDLVRAKSALRHMSARLS